ncbi:MAG: 2-oxoglutarate dehydrogenase complex dihydrolipoyllysine-residue succinyltransferase [Bdellovibrionaceae bacterium]|nr:2-oxoglutarate dehydrogenase complex dihydrolipoyllysine-residue succinyltransferase [Pseudobdellovibrionaceae bacterium]
MKVEVKVPAVGESVTEAVIGSWSKKNGDYVRRNDVLLLLETDKASVEVVAENDGVLTIQAEAGSTVKIGATIATIDTEAKPTVSAEAKSAAPAHKPPPTPSSATRAEVPAAEIHLSPAVQKIVTEKGLNPSTIQGTGKDGRLTKGDVLAALESTGSTTIVTPTTNKATTPAPTPRTSRQGDKKLVPMTTIRKRIAERLLESQNTTATLTTFNEIDMSRLNAIRAKYKDKFKEKYGVNLGFMGFFVKAAIEALKAYPAVNAYIVGDNIEYHNYYNIGVAVSTDKGLLVPVIRDADQMNIAEIELAIKNYALKARDGKISVDDLSGGTFTISNGGVFGSLMSTPILNPPQSGILGMHKVEDRPVVIDGKIEIRPMMYVALSYDHRIIDGRESVGFLVKIKEGVEDPERLLLEI